MLVVPTADLAAYLLWFVPPSEYDSDIQPDQHDSWFWILGAVVVVHIVDGHSHRYRYCRDSVSSEPAPEPKIKRPSLLARIVSRGVASPL